MSSARDQMELCEAILALIEAKRVQTGNPTLGEAIESAILDAQVQDIEAEILENPGAFEPWLLRRRPN